MAVVKIPRTPADDDQADGDTPPWEKDVSPGWHPATITSVDVGKWDAGMLTLRYKVAGAIVDDRADLTDERGLRKLGKIAAACGIEGDDVDTDALDGAQLEINVKHGGARDKPPYHWINVVGWRKLGAAPGGPVAQELPADVAGFFEEEPAGQGEDSLPF